MLWAALKKKSGLVQRGILLAVVKVMPGRISGLLVLKSLLKLEFEFTASSTHTRDDGNGTAPSLSDYEDNEGDSFTVIKLAF